MKDGLRRTAWRRSTTTAATPSFLGGSSDSCRAEGRRSVAAPVFSSYSWSDWDGEVDTFDLMLRLRGVPIFRDRADMQWGNGIERQLLEQMLTDCSGYVLYVTENALESAFITKTELPAMHRRRLSDRSFFTGAVFRDFEPGAGGLAIHGASGVNIGTTLGSKLDLATELEPQFARIAKQILGAYLNANWVSGPATARLETRNGIPNTDPASLHLIWSPPLAHDVDTYDGSCWEGQIVPALADLRAALEWALDGRREQTLRVTGAAHLSAALALGYEFREATHWNLLLESRGEEWSTGPDQPDRGDWEFVVEPGPITASELVVGVHIAQDVSDAVREHRRQAGPARAELHVRRSSSDGRRALSPDNGNKLAGAVAKAIRTEARTYGTKETHLFLACPWPFAALLGWHLASSGIVVSHEATVARDGYRPACRLT
jgi:hypothetical protein